MLLTGAVMMAITTAHIRHRWQRRPRADAMAARAGVPAVALA
jgi:hypothetical protein